MELEEQRRVAQRNLSLDWEQEQQQQRSNRSSYANLVSVKKVGGAPAERDHGDMKLEFRRVGGQIQGVIAKGSTRRDKQGRKPQHSQQISVALDDQLSAPALLDTYVSIYRYIGK